MGERGRVECPVCGAMGEPFPCGHHLHFARELASALKRCENALEIALESDAIHQAKCERLEAAIRKHRDDMAPNHPDGDFPSQDRDLYAALSTPKTEGERCPTCGWGRSGSGLVHCPDSFHSPDPIGRDVRGYEK